MYRDASTALDERDRAVGAILIGEALIAACERARVVGESNGPAAWRAIRDAYDDFPEIWLCLDRARHELARRGVNVTGYDELRPHVRTRLASPGPDDVVRVDPAALDDARRATDELKLAVPGADWAAIEQRTSGLVHAPLIQRRRSRLILGGMAGVFAIAVLLWSATTLIPPRKLGRSELMRRQIAQIAQERKIKIIALQTSITGRCEPVTAHELARQLVMEGRGADVREFATQYEARCGDDPVITHWASAPLHAASDPEGRRSATYQAQPASASAGRPTGGGERGFDSRRSAP